MNRAFQAQASESLICVRNKLWQIKDSRMPLTAYNKGVVCGLDLALQALKEEMDRLSATQKENTKNSDSHTECGNAD
jgi:hypothetical protein